MEEKLKNNNEPDNVIGIEWLKEIDLNKGSKKNYKKISNSELILTNNELNKLKNVPLDEIIEDVSDPDAIWSINYEVDWYNIYLTYTIQTKILFIT